MKKLLKSCRCGGSARFNNGSSHAHNYKIGEQERMRSCAVSCKECGIKIKRGKWYFDSEGGYEKAKEEARLKWNKFMK